LLSKWTDTVYGTQSTGSTVPDILNPLNAELNPICHLLALVGARYIVHVSRVNLDRIHTHTSRCT
jgi:hypothetical protein